MGSWNTIYNNTMFGVQYHSQSMARLQEQITTGSRIIRSSDEPAGAHRIMSLQDNIDALDNYDNNLTEVELSLSEASNALQNLSELIARVDVLTTQASNGTYGGENRVAMAEEIDQILEQCVSLANHKVLNRYIFGGQESSRAPYEVTYENGRIVDMRYVGGYRDQPVPVGPGVTMSGQLVGESIFRNDKRQTPEIYGATGAAVGSGTSSLQGDHWLRLNHTLSTYNAGSGVVMGTSGVKGDTILGDDHTITIGGGMIRLDGGQDVAYTGAETNLKLTNEVGDVVYVNLTGALVDGTWSIQADGEVALDDGTGIALNNFALDNFAVTDPDDPDRFLYINTNDIQRTGVDAVTVPGTYDLFETLIYTRDVLMNNEGLDDADLTEAIQRVSGSIVEVGDGVRRRMTIVGGRIGAADTLRGTLDDLQFNAQTESTSIQEADITELAVKLAKSETLYQMSLQIAAKTMSLSLLDYMR
ncbi:MAG: flagellar hook-associated protein FlgL [Phycisphaerae bacterium]|nr:flagellar hook-associated protein FlgL [Phycisphaerae bacterium]